MLKKNLIVYTSVAIVAGGGNLSPEPDTPDMFFETKEITPLCDSRKVAKELVRRHFFGMSVKPRFIGSVSTEAEMERCCYILYAANPNAGVDWEEHANEAMKNAFNGNDSIAFEQLLRYSILHVHPVDMEIIISTDSIVVKDRVNEQIFEWQGGTAVPIPFLLPLSFKT